MSRLLHSLAFFLRRMPWSAPAEWSEADARALAAFLAGAPGRKLTALLTAEIATANERAAMSQGSPFACGWACGYRGLLAWFQALSAPAPAEAAEADPAAAPLEHFHP